MLLMLRYVVLLMFRLLNQLLMPEAFDSNPPCVIIPAMQLTFQKPSAARRAAPMRQAETGNVPTAASHRSASSARHLDQPATELLPTAFLAGGKVAMLFLLLRELERAEAGPKRREACMWCGAGTAVPGEKVAVAAPHAQLFHATSRPLPLAEHRQVTSERLLEFCARCPF